MRVMTEANGVTRSKRMDLAAFLTMAAVLAVALAFSAGMAVAFELVLDAPVLG